MMARKALSRESRIFVQVAKRAQAKDVPPSLPAMLGRIVEHVAALAQCGEIARHVVPRIVIEMCTGQHHIGRTNGRHVEPSPPLPPNCNPSATVRTPIPGIGIPPSPVTEMCDEAEMGSRAPFTARAGTIEADRVRQLLPIDWVEPAVLGADRHHDSMSQYGCEQKGIRQHVVNSNCRHVDLSWCRRVHTTNPPPFDVDMSSSSPVTATAW